MTRYLRLLATLFMAGPALADQSLTVAGQNVMVVDDPSGGSALLVGGQTLLTSGVIYLDPDPLIVAGVTVVTGVAGSGGNACNPAPFVLALPEAAPAELSGPVDSCAHLPIIDVDAQSITFAADPLPATPGEVWVWTRDTGLAADAARPFAAKPGLGWQELDWLAGAHPVDAFALAPVLEVLQTGLGPDFPAFAERISGIGAGNLTAEGYLGSACDKPTCEADWAILYLHRETRGIFAIWQVYGDTAPRLWPADRALWPPEALALLEWEAAE